MSTPVDLDEFNLVFPSWPDDSLSHRVDRIPAGSSWDIRELGTFQILRSPPVENIPQWLQSHFKEASARVLESAPMQSVLQLFREDWRNETHEYLTQAAGPLASFVTLLSQVLEPAIVSDPRRELRGQEIHEHAISSSSPSSSSSIPSSPPEFSNKRIRKDRPSSSYLPSDASDQSSHDQRAKSEATTNACIYELYAASLRFQETRTILLSAWSGLLRKTLSEFMQDHTNTVLQTMAISYIKLIALVVGNVLLITHIAPSRPSLGTIPQENLVLSKRKKLHT